jgi:hypothetical protein
MPVKLLGLLQSDRSLLGSAFCRSLRAVRVFDYVEEVKAAVGRHPISIVLEVKQMIIISVYVSRWEMGEVCPRCGTLWSTRVGAQ